MFGVIKPDSDSPPRNGSSYAELRERIRKLEAALRECEPALDIAMQHANPRQRDHWHKIMVRCSQALTDPETGDKP